MRKGLLIGFFAGALAAAVMFKLLVRTDAAADAGGEAKAAGVEPRPGGAADAGPGAAELKARLESAERTVQALRDRLAELEGRTAAAGSPSRVPRAVRWRELADLIAAAKAEADRTGQPIRNDTWLAPLLELIGEHMRDTGLPLGEAAMSPDWYPMFALAVLGSSPFPPTPEQRAAWEKVLTGSRARWEEYMARRDTLSPLERAQALQEMEFATRSGMALHATADQAGWMAGLNMPPPAAPVGTVNCGAGPREACRRNLEKHWQQALKLDPDQVTSLGPVMDDYVRDMESLQRDLDRRRAAGESTNDQGAKIGLMLEYQKRVGGTARLSEGQLKLLREWNATYDMQIKD